MPSSPNRRARTRDKTRFTATSARALYLSYQNRPMAPRNFWMTVRMPVM